jgi:heme exporter protein CcmD
VIDLSVSGLAVLDLGRHGGFILASYVVTIAVISGLVWRSASRYRAAKRRLAEVTRQSDD